ncbi:MAG: hypothetical protein SVR08_11940 [Spirochaetota bacterium]|nr:hypothetical protein [Spirochaetota bacterium]
MSQVRISKTYDTLLELKDAGLVAASAAAEVDSAAQILDVGTGMMRGDIIIDVSACEVDTGDESYLVFAQVSSSASFASDIYNVGCMPLGDAAGIATACGAGDVDQVAGRHILPITNVVQDGLAKRYLRLYTVVAGTVATGINYSAYLAKE